MTSLERRARHRAELHSAIIEAALAIISEHGLAALSIRAIADRIEYSAATIYLHFESKEALVREVAHEGFRRMHERVRAAVADCGPNADRAQALRALFRSYLGFALEHPAYFRVMFDVPAALRLDTAATTVPAAGCDPIHALAPAAAYGLAGGPGSPCLPECADELGVPVAAVAAVHGLVSLYLAGRLEHVGSTDDLLRLAEECLAPYTTTSVREGAGGLPA